MTNAQARHVVVGELLDHLVKHGWAEQIDSEAALRRDLVTFFSKRDAVGDEGEQPGITVSEAVPF